MVNKIDVKQSLISIEVTLAIKTEKSQVCTFVFRVQANDRTLSTLTLSSLFLSFLVVESARYGSRYFSLDITRHSQTRIIQLFPKMQKQIFFRFSYG